MPDLIRHPGAIPTKVRNQIQTLDSGFRRNDTLSHLRNKMGVNVFHQPVNKKVF
jgi:hypothetical protein